MMRNMNTAMLLECLSEKGPQTRKELQEHTKLSWGAISNIVSELLEQNILLEQQQPSTFSGRKPSVIAINNQSNLLVGIDLHMHGITAVVTDLTESVLADRYQSIDGMGREEVLEAAVDVVHSMMDELGIAGEDLAGIGVTVMGMIDQERRGSLYSPHMPAWRNVPVCDLFEKEFHTPTYLTRDTNAMLLMEKKSSRQDISNMLFVNHDMGIGMAIMADGELYSGFAGNAGELGHMIINPNGPKCTCGNYGCLEAYASGQSLLRNIQAGAGRGKCDELPKGLSFSDAAAAAAQMAYEGNEFVCEQFRHMGQVLGLGLYNVIDLFNPQMVVLGGVVSAYADLYLEEIQQAVDRHIWNDDHVEIVLSRQGEKGAARGAAAHVLQLLMSGKIPDAMNGLLRST